METDRVVVSAVVVMSQRWPRALLQARADKPLPRPNKTQPQLRPCPPFLSKCDLFSNRLGLLSIKSVRNPRGNPRGNPVAPEVRVLRSVPVVAVPLQLLWTPSNAGTHISCVVKVSELGNWQGSGAPVPGEASVVHCPVGVPATCSACFLQKPTFGTSACVYWRRLLVLHLAYEAVIIKGG